MIDPRLFLMINGPQSQPVQLVPGFHPPGSGPSAPLLPPPQMQQPQIPGFGLSGLGSPWSPTSGGANPGVPTANGDPTGGSGPAFLGGASPLGNPMQAVNPNSVTTPQGGGFFNWLRGLF